MTDQTPILDIQTDFLETSFDFESWALKVEYSVTYKQKSLAEWSEELATPRISEDMEFSDIEKLNIQVVELSETIHKNLAITKAAFYAARAAHSISMQKARQEILDNLDSSKRSPSQESMEKLCLDKCMSTWRISFMAEILFEFWTTHSFKLSRLDSRLTSLNILKSIESKTTSAY